MWSASTPRKPNIAPTSMQQPSAHRIGVNAPRKKKAASRAKPAKAHCDEMISPPGKAIINSIAAAVALSKASAIPAEPVGNMEKSLCIAPTVTTSYGLDKREKGVQEAILLRGVRGSRAIFFASRKSEASSHFFFRPRSLQNCFKIAHPVVVPLRADQRALRWRQERVPQG
jgi:hypothetical protein